MKNLFFSLALLLVTLSPHAQAADPSRSPEQVIHDFYRWYVQALMKNREPLTKERAELKRYASDRLIREIDHMRKGPDGLDGDYFLDAQDFDDDWATNIKVSGTSIKGDRATALVELSGKEIGTKKLRVTLVQQAGQWKVDKVEGVEGSAAAR